MNQPSEYVKMKVLAAIEQAKPFFRGDDFRLSELYRLCIEKGLLRRDQIAPNTFRRLVKQYELIKPDREVRSKKRLAFAKRYANEMWQADTLYGPHVRDHTGKARQTRLIAFIDDASRLLCHGQFFFEENRPALNAALIHAVRAQKRTADTPEVNAALMQPHWRTQDQWLHAEPAPANLTAKTR